MAEIEVTFKNGDTQTWQLHDATDLGELVKSLTRSTGATRVISFGIPSEDGGAADYDFVGLAMSEVIWWRVRGLFDESSGAALWAELRTAGNEGEA